VRICDLKLRLEGSPLEARIAQLYAELDLRGLPLHPPCYLGDEWFSPIPTPAIAIPLPPSRPRLRPGGGGSHAATASSTSVRLRSEWSPGTCTTVRPGPGGGIPKGSRSPWTTRTGPAGPGSRGQVRGLDPATGAVAEDQRSHRPLGALEPHPGATMRCWELEHAATSVA